LKHPRILVGTINVCVVGESGSSEATYGMLGSMLENTFTVWLAAGLLRISTSIIPDGKSCGRSSEERLLKMRIKKEVKELCLKMLNSTVGSEEWRKAKDELIRKWKFTPFNLLSLYEPEPVIEFNDRNMFLIMEREDSEG